MVTGGRGRPDSRWYIGGIALALLIFALHPSPVSDLNLSVVPDRGGAIFVGLFYGICGCMFAFGIAWVRGGRLRFPSTDRYPGGVLSSVGTAFYDEFLFRGVILGLLLGLGLPDWVAVGAAAILYAGAVRASTTGRGVLDTAVALVIGLASGLVVLLTGGIAGAIVGDAITRFALFLAVGHAHDPRRSRARCRRRSSTSSRHAVARRTSAGTMDGEGSVRSALPDEAWAPAPPEGLYVHMPFCVSVCPYCDFVVVGGAAARGPTALVDQLVDALHVELSLRADRQPGDGPLTSVYIGGGTPSLLPAVVGRASARRHRPPARHRGGRGGHARGQPGTRRPRRPARIPRRGRDAPVDRRPEP